MITPRTGDRTPALSRGLAVLEAVAAAGCPIGFTELAVRLPMPRASLVRLLATLRDGGWLARTSTGYVPGPRCRRLALARAAPARDARRILARLSATTRCTALWLAWRPPAMVAEAKHLHPAAPVMQELGQRSTAATPLPGPWWWLADWHGWSRLRGEAPPGARRFWRSHAVAFDDERVLAFVRRLAVAVLPVGLPHGPPIGFLGIAGNRLLLPDGGLPLAADALVQAAERMSVDG